MKNRFTTALLFVVAALICGCGGSSSSSPTDFTDIPIDASGLDNTGSVPVDSPFGFTLMQSIQEGTVTDDTFYLASGTSCDVSSRVPANITISTNKKNINLAAISPLEFSTTYTICITSRILYENGTPIRGWSFTFTTVGRGETAVPQVSETSPLNGDTDIRVNSTVWVKFNTALDSSTVNSSTFTLASSNGNVSGIVTYSADTYTAAFTPSSALESLIVYTATASSSIKNAGGVNLAANFSWTFTTEYIDSGISYSATPSIGVGANHACALLANGTVKCWGSNEYGQLGRGTVSNPTYSAAASLVKNQDGSTLTDVVELAAAKNNNFVRISNGTVKGWGYNGAWNSLGDGGPADFQLTTDYAYPVNVIDASTGRAIQGATSLKAYYTNACVIVNKGVKCWGDNSWGQIGNGSTTYWPNRVTSATDVVGLESGADVQQLAVGANAACVLTSDNRINCWGRDSYGSLGRGSTAYCPGGTDPYAEGSCIKLTPGFVLSNADGTQLTGVTTLYFIYGSGCGVQSNGKYYCWGHPQLGSQTGVATEAPNLIGMTSLTSGYYNGCGIFYSTVQCWGTNKADVGNVGVGNMSEVTYSTAQNVSTSATAISVAAAVNDWSPQHGANCAMLTDYTVECWGANTSGQLGDGSATNRSTPVKVTDGETGGNLDLTP